MEDFLKGAKLDHLCDALVSKLSIDDAFGLLDQGRPKLLDKLKELGVSKIPERQAFAKAIANGKRELVGAGLPVLVITYSTGLQPAEGRDLMKPIVEAAAAAGFVDSVVLDHCNEAPYKGTVSSNDEYARALRDTVYKAKEGYDGRPLVVVAHSNGTVGAYGLARLLGSKVRALCVLGRRPPSMPLLPDAIGVQTIAEVMALSAHDLAQRMSTAYDNAVLQVHTPRLTPCTPSHRVSARPPTASSLTACALRRAAGLHEEPRRLDVAAEHPARRADLTRTVRLAVRAVRCGGDLGSHLPARRRRAGGGARECAHLRCREQAGDGAG
jgi:pimeloyl-ACP methyl ester carboxylesterase